MSGYVQRFLVQPTARAVNKIEARSAKKLSSKASPAVSAWIAENQAIGADAASMSTKRYLSEQSQMMSYRVVRCCEECRHIFSGAFFKDFGGAKAIRCARYFTEALLIFIMAVIVGRRSIYPPIAPDSPLAIALEHKVNPNY